jgi:hypothetical protein
MKTEPVFLHLGEGEYVLLHRAEYLRLCSGGAPEGLQLADAKAAVIAEMSKRVRLAREQAGLTQSALPKRLRGSAAPRAEQCASRARTLDACSRPASCPPTGSRSAKDFPCPALGLLRPPPAEQMLSSTQLRNRIPLVGA